MLTTAFRLPCTLCAMAWLSACAPLAAMVGHGGPLVQVAAAIDRVKLAGDGVSYLGSGKTITDHAVSMVVGADCHLLNMLSTEPICTPARDAVADNKNSSVEVAAHDDPPAGEAPALADSSYVMDRKLIAGFSNGADDSALAP